MMTKNFKFDNGSEFANRKIEELFKNHKISFEYGRVYMPTD